jgi:plasmid stabilization system protein ParE
VSRAVRFRPEAQAEALETRAWYEGRQSGLGDAFTTELQAIISRISENPEQFRRARGETRRAVLNRFPYAVYFRVHQREVIVLAVHGRQHPRRWQSRK